MKQYQQKEYIHIQNGCQQLKFVGCSKQEIRVEKNEFYRQVSAQLEELEYRELYEAYSGTIRKSQVEPRILFEILVCAYMQGIYSTRKIEALCRENIQFILILDGQEPPDHSTLSRFRSREKTGKAIEGLFYQYVQILERDGWTDHEAVFVDGTKLESRANRYTFVWGKNIRRELEKIRAKVKERFGESDGYVTRKKLDQRVEELNQQIEKQQITVRKGRGHHKPEIMRERDELQQLSERWTDYEQKKALLGEGRNSYSKTDPDATFMHMKDDHMRNGQLKPGYNVQFAVNSQFVTGIGVFPNRTDYATLPPLLDELYTRHGKRYKKVVADSGYESLSNYRYLHDHEQLAFIKPNNYESSKARKFRKQIGRAENMAYYEPGDYFVCKAERILPKVGTHTERAGDGTKREMFVYRCEDCHDCPYRAACCKARDPEKQKEIVICWEQTKFRKASLERITSDEGKLLRVNRSIQAEGSFGELKHNRGFKRFLMFSKVKIQTELYLLVLSQNIMKRISKCNTGKEKTHLLHPKALLNF